jgi:hypothetical protein
MNLALLERVINPCSVVDCEDCEKYPLLTDKKFFMIEGIGQRMRIRDVFVFVFVRFDNSQNPFVDIYLRDDSLEDKSFQRFVICDGMCLSEEKEKRLLAYCRYRSLYINDSDMALFNYAVARYFPQWNYGENVFEDIGEAIEYVYFVSHPGPKEILYKAGFNNIVYYLDSYESYNMIGTTPQAIIGHNVSLRLLRIFNQPVFTEYFLEEDQIERAVQVYSAFSGYIGNEFPTMGQWLYLDGLYFRGMTDKSEFSRTIYNYLKSVDTFWIKSKAIVDTYFCFLELRESMGLVNKIKIPKPTELEEVLRRLETIKENKKYERLYQIRVRRDAVWYEYSGEKYMVVFPKTPDDIFLEALSLRNCLGNYYERHANCQTTILFIRKKEEPDKPFVAMEVTGGRIIQVRAAFNREPDQSVLDFVTEYAKEMNFNNAHDELDPFFAV